MKLSRAKQLAKPDNVTFGLTLLAFSVLLSACNSETTQQQRQYPEMDSMQAQLYINKCGDCHAAPLPSVHTSEVWPGVLQRMQFRMTSKKVVKLTDEEMVDILNYLQKHAKPSS